MAKPQHLFLSSVILGNSLKLAVDLSTHFFFSVHGIVLSQNMPRLKKELEALAVLALVYLVPWSACFLSELPSFWVFTEQSTLF